MRRQSLCSCPRPISTSCSHAAPLALAEFLRVLDAQGDALITCPYLCLVCVGTLARATQVFELWTLASKSARSEQEMMALMRGIRVRGLNCGSAW